MDIQQKTHAEFLQTMLANLANTEDKTPNSFSYDILSSTSIVFKYMQSTIIDLLKLFDVDNLHGVDLDKRVLQIAGLERKKATRSTGVVTVTGEMGIEIKEGTLFLADEMEFRADKTLKIPASGVVDVPITSEIYGAAANVVSGAITKMEPRIVGITNITNITNRAPIENGYAEESDDDLRERYYDVLLNPPRGGNPAHYKLWATEVDGIWDAKVFRTWKGPSTVRVVVVGLDRKKLDTRMITKVKDHIMAEAPIAYEHLTVESAKLKPVNATVTVVADEGTEVQAVKDRIKEKLNEYFFSISFRQSFVSLAKVGRAILDIDTIYDYEDLTLNGAAENVLLADDEIPDIGEIDVTIKPRR